MFCKARTLFNLTVPARNLIKPTSSYHIALLTATLWLLFLLTFFTKLLCSLRKDDDFFDNVKLCGIQKCPDVTDRAGLLPGKKVCVGLAPHHLMFEITPHATQKVGSIKNFLIRLFSIKQKKYLPFWSVCWKRRENFAITGKVKLS